MPRKRTGEALTGARLKPGEALTTGRPPAMRACGRGCGAGRGRALAWQAGEHLVDVAEHGFGQIGVGQEPGQRTSGRPRRLASARPFMPSGRMARRARRRPLPPRGARAERRWRRGLRGGASMPCGPRRNRRKVARAWHRRRPGPGRGRARPTSPRGAWRRAGRAGRGAGGPRSPGRVREGRQRHRPFRIGQRRPGAAAGEATLHGGRSSAQTLLVERCDLRSQG